MGDNAFTFTYRQQNSVKLNSLICELIRNILPSRLRVLIQNMMTLCLWCRNHGNSQEKHSASCKNFIFFKKFKKRLLRYIIQDNSEIRGLLVVSVYLKSPIIIRKSRNSTIPIMNYASQTKLTRDYKNTKF